MLVGVEVPEAPPEASLEREGDRDLCFFLSDRIGELELEPVDRGLLEDPLGLEASDFLEEKNLPLNTIFVCLPFRRTYSVGLELSCSRLITWK